MGNIIKYQIPAGSLPESKDTLNTNYLAFKETLPDNLRLTPEKDYHMYDYWRLSGEPENFTEGKQRGMFTWDKSDKGYHAGSIAEDRNTGIYHFMKPKHHPTVKYELDWFNKGLKTLEGGKQVPVKGRDKKFWEDFTSKYQLDTTGVDYRYVPIQKKGGNIHIKKKNRGKFTEYCGGKVTEECIKKGKNSSNPTIRKRAVFAANARKWKHQEGGILQKAGEIAGGFIPLYGTYLNWKDYKENPTLANLGWTIASGLGDIASLTGIGYGIIAGTKAIKAANTARKGVKAINTARKATRAANQIKMLEYGDVGKNAWKGWVASGKNLANSNKKLSEAVKALQQAGVRFAIDGGIDTIDAGRTAIK